MKKRIAVLLLSVMMLVTLASCARPYVDDYFIAFLKNDQDKKNELDYLLNEQNFEPHRVDLEAKEHDGIQLIFVETQYATDLYLRGWIGVDYADGAWYSGRSSTDRQTIGALDIYRDLYEMNEFPSDRMFYDFYSLLHPQMEIFDPDYDFLTKYKKFDEFGFIATSVHLRHVNSESTRVYLPAVFDQSRGLRDYGSDQPSEHSFVNFFDGMLTGRDFAKNGVKYSAVTFAPTKGNAQWIDTLSADIAEYNLQKELIFAFNSYTADNSSDQEDQSFCSIKVERDTPAKDLTTVSYRKSGRELTSFVHKSEDVNYSSWDKQVILKSGSGAEYVIEYDSSYRVKSVRGDNNESLFHTYCAASLAQREEINRILFEDPGTEFSYTQYVYDIYTAKSDSQIIADLAREIYEQDYDASAYDFSCAALTNAAFLDAAKQRNDLVYAVIDYITDDLGCKYTKTPALGRVDEGLDGVENFLTVTKEGYSEQYASAVALILREYGIPTRYVEGYLAHDFDINRFSNAVGRFSTYVHDYNAHAWVEVFFDGIGWVQYECTPGTFEIMKEGIGE